MIRGPVLPAALEVSHGAVFLGESIDLVGVFSFVFVPGRDHGLQMNTRIHPEQGLRDNICRRDSRWD